MGDFLPLFMFNISDLTEIYKRPDGNEETKKPQVHLILQFSTRV